jgi:glycosyltransferase involved in cell wall biosynthesis
MVAAAKQMAGRTLLVASMPSTDAGVGGVFLRDMFAAVEEGGFVEVPILSPRYAKRRLGVGEGVVMPAEAIVSSFRVGRHVTGIAGNLRELRTEFRYRREVRRLAELLANKAREHGASRLLFVLDHPILFALAHEARSRIGLPMSVLVWDAPEHLLSRATFGALGRRRAMQDFARSLASADRVGVMSDAMQDCYSQMTRARFQLIRLGKDPLPAGEASGPPDNEWVLGFAGSLYAESAWFALLKALDSVDWRLEGKSVVLRLIAPRAQLRSTRAAHIQYLGFLPGEREVDAALQGCHLTYLPQPFEEHLAMVSRFSFPAKLTSYLSVDRPVLVHAPGDSALARFCRENPVGAVVETLDPAAIVEALRGLLGGPGLQSASHAARATREQYFSASVFANAVRGLLAEPGTP